MEDIGEDARVVGGSTTEGEVLVQWPDGSEGGLYWRNGQWNFHASAEEKAERAVGA